MNTNKKVDEYMKSSKNPLKDLWEQIREIILKADPKMEEDIKWAAPTFLYKENMATFNPQAKKFVNLTFHTGALISDPDGILEGDSKQARVFRVADSAELNRKKKGLEKVVKNWIQLIDS